VNRLRLSRRAWVLTGVCRNSFTWDEDDHIYSGYMSWKHGDFGTIQFEHALQRVSEDQAAS